MKQLLAVAHLDGLRQVTSELGIDLDVIAAECRLSDSIARDGDKFIEHRKLIDLVNLAAQKSRRRDFGLLWGARSSLMLLGPMAVAMLNAPTPRRPVARGILAEAESGPACRARAT